MRTRMLRRYTTQTTRTLLVLVSVAALVGFVQALVWETSRVFSPSAPQRSTQSFDHIESPTSRRIASSRKRVTVDGALHLRQYLEPKSEGDMRRIELRDSADTVIWTGPERDNPYQYVKWRKAISIDEPRRRPYSRSVGNGLWRPLILPVVDSDRNILENWRYDEADQVFVGYDRDGRTIGCWRSRSAWRSPMCRRGLWMKWWRGIAIWKIIHVGSSPGSTRLTPMARSPRWTRSPGNSPARKPLRPSVPGSLSRLNLLMCPSSFARFFEAHRLLSIVRTPSGMCGGDTTGRPLAPIACRTWPLRPSWERWPRRSPRRTPLPIGWSA